MNINSNEWGMSSWASNRDMENTGAQHAGIIFRPFDNAAPSEYTDTQAGYTTTSDESAAHTGARRATINPSGSGWISRPDAGGTRLYASSPVGDAVTPLMLMALCYGFVRSFLRKRVALLFLLFLPICSYAGITGLTVTAAEGATAGGGIVINPSVSSVPEGTAYLCWEMYYDAGCTHKVPGITFTRAAESGANAVACTLPAEEGNYYLKSTLRSGSKCDGAVDNSCVMALAVYPADADILLSREAQGSGERIDLTSDAEKKAYATLQIDRAVLSNDTKTLAERYNYFVSFPFDVRVGDIYGIGEVGTHWLLYYYDGKGRAQNGFFAERTDNWAMIDDTDDILHAGEGYLLQLNTIAMAEDDTWQNGADKVTLYFPSRSTISDITTANETIPALGDEYRCTIDLSDRLGGDGDRREKDSYWRCIGTPGFGTPSGINGVKYLYQWDTKENSLDVASAAGFAFQPMHAYLVQYGGEIVWTGVSKPASVVAKVPETQICEWQMTIRQGAETCDRTFVQLSDEAKETFEFGKDLIKELNAGKNNLYTLIGQERVAGNCLPMREQTTVVPVGVQIAAEGEYTFAMPEGANGTGAVLIDNIAGTRTNLGLTDYTVTLGKGTYDSRFVLELSPVAQTPTGIGEIPSNQVSSTKARKVLIDGILYLMYEGTMYDVRGNKVRGMNIAE